MTGEVETITAGEARGVAEKLRCIAGRGGPEMEHRSKDILGRVWGCRFVRVAGGEARKGGESYAMRLAFKLVVNMLEPYYTRAYEADCCSSGMLGRSFEFIRTQASGNCNLPARRLTAGKVRAYTSVYGQRSRSAICGLTKMNHAIRGIPAQTAHGHSFHNDRFPDLEAGFVLASPPLNDSDSAAERLLEDDKCLGYLVPPAGNVNSPKVQHSLCRLIPGRIADSIQANGLTSARESGYR